MANLNLIPNSNLPPIPNDVVNLEVKVDYSRCNRPPQSLIDKLQNIEENGINVEISKIIAYSGIQFHKVAQDFLGIGTQLSLIQNSWQNIANWHPRSEIRKKDNKKKLIIDDHDNPNIKRFNTELLGVGVGLYTAKTIYDVPYRFWVSGGHSRFDFYAPTKNNKKINIEVRGRFKKNQWKKAIEQVYNKIPANSEFENYAGIIYAPRKSAATSSEDIFILDPNGKDKEQDLFFKYRCILLHYLPYFVEQNFIAFSNRLIEIIQFPKEQFYNYINFGDSILEKSQSSRSYFKIGKFRFLGTAWDGVCWPSHFTGLVDNFEGAFFSGVWDEIINAIIKGKLEDISNLQIKENIGSVKGYVQILLDDGRALSWAKTKEELLNHP